MLVCKSRFTPNITDASEVNLVIGELCTYKEYEYGTGRKMVVEIISEVKSRAESSVLGYDVRCLHNQSQVLRRRNQIDFRSLLLGRKEGPMLILQKRPEPEKATDVMVRIAGNCFRCSCGCNVFRHPNDAATGKLIKDRYVCNGCGSQYRGEG